MVCHQEKSQSIKRCHQFGILIVIDQAAENNVDFSMSPTVQTKSTCNHKWDKNKHKNSTRETPTRMSAQIIFIEFRELDKFRSTTTKMLYFLAEILSSCYLFFVFSAPSHFIASDSNEAENCHLNIIQYELCWHEQYAYTCYLNVLLPFDHLLYKNSRNHWSIIMNFECHASFQQSTFFFFLWMSDIVTYSVEYIVLESPESRLQFSNISFNVTLSRQMSKNTSTLWKHCVWVCLWAF